MTGATIAQRVDAWLGELGLRPVERVERDGITSWDLVLDAARRRDIRSTLILDPGFALLCWVHYAPPLNDSFRVSYRQFLHWNDELPFVKFALSEDERPVLITEIPVQSVDLDTLGLTLARTLRVCDLLLDSSVHWLWPGRARPPVHTGPTRNEALLERYAEQLSELALRETHDHPAEVPADATSPAGAGAATDGGQSDPATPPVGSDPDR